ncbi:MAG: stage V sporulation protein AC [Anaerotignum sp.]|nr:stage V sporulation protein AC [Anaerotignum sp.]MBR5816425.1 stage V sporulation protein AC [Anaerotignum sp.]MBR6542362.1 stage V sporulation protein AC [Anaerotignum sp.]
MVKQASPNSPVFMDCVKAFFSGGLICVFGQLLLDFFTGRGISDKDAAMWVSITLIGISAVLTSLGIYEKLGKFCGAGTIVPITGFANSVVSPAIEFKKEGMVFGMAAKMFVVAGPVIVYGTLTSMLVGVVYYFVK